MYSYKIHIKKVSGKLNESKTPKKTLVIKSKKVKNGQEVFNEAAKYLKEKYGLVLESADVGGAHDIKVYVGTWGKYAGGSIDGGWVNLGNFSSPEEYHHYLRTKLHADEQDAEYMIQDVEGPSWVREYIGEYGMNEEFVWGYLNLDDYEKPVLDGWLEVSGEKYDDIDEAVSDANDHYSGGEGQDFDDWVYDFMRDTSGHMTVQEMINGQYYNWIDWDNVKEWFSEGYSDWDEEEGDVVDYEPEDSEMEDYVLGAYGTFNDLDDAGLIDWPYITRDLKYEFTSAGNGCVYHMY